MALKKTLAQRLLSITKISSQSFSKCRISSSSSSVQNRIPRTASKPDIAPDPGDNGVFRRFLHKRAVFRPELRSPPPAADNLLQKLREMDIFKSRIRLDGLSPPATYQGVTVEDARKLLRAAQLEMVKSKLRMIPQNCISYSEFIRICAENCSDQDQATRIAKMLDDSADVIILGDVVFLRPEQEIESLLFPQI
ncbi:calcium uniporter protein 2, mitochondrial-like isoform X2 [Gastrolobium bilobum]|uniref:calcium uniporter protein 2, mitochondrial-like isoform X2 n=1 Tax=Gastrolobium bilobum TaxID=150636 RepID=UPI002AB30253|nr:calcium uniporter protein 2, mitochondrial-like isoform X2 [Gastrolobium bilobum]